MMTTTVNILMIIMKRIYEDLIIWTSLEHRTLKKLVQDACSKTAVILDGVIYEQKDGISIILTLSIVP